jgi:glutaredoxin
MVAKTKIKDLLKGEIKGELAAQKEKAKQENLERNAKLREVIIYTRNGCEYSKELKDILKEEGIKFIEKEVSKYRNEFNIVSNTVGMGIFPTMLVNENYIIPNRDYQNLPQGVEILKIYGSPEFKNPDFKVKLLESLKTLNFNINTSLKTTNDKLYPLLDLTENILKVVDEEEDNNGEVKKTKPKKKGCGCGKKS